MANARRYHAPTRAGGAMFGHAGAVPRPFRLALLLAAIATVFISVALVRALVVSATRAVELNSARASLESFRMRGKDLERRLAAAESARDEARRGGEAERAAAARARAEVDRARAEAERAREEMEAMEARSAVEQARESVESVVGGGKRTESTATAAAAEDVFGERAMRDVQDAASVSSKRQVVVTNTSEAEDAKEDAEPKTESDEETGDISSIKVKPTVESATFSDPLLKNLAVSSERVKKDVTFTCNGKAHTELWGAVVKDGSTNPQPDAAACCDSCAKMNAGGANRCSVWVYSASSKACWLKYEQDPKNAKPANEGPGVEWMSGYFELPNERIEPKYEPATGKTDMPKCVHTVITSSGNVYMNWQSRIMYASYLRHAAEPGSIMKAFTRILHKGREDELMHEIPTMRFNPVQSKCDGWCDYPVADRSKAVSDWLQTADSERCSHVVMLETDHIIVKSPSPEILLPEGQAMGFKFGYMNPTQPTIKKLYPEYFTEGKKMPPTGNSPTVVNTVDLRKIAPLWAKFVNETETPESVRKELGWVRDMYSYDLAVLASGVEHQLDEVPNSLLLAQPPADSELGNAYILHYTWGSEIYDKNEQFIWKFDKRSYADGQYGQGPYILTEIPPPPEWDESKGLQLQNFFQPRKLTEKRLALIKTLIDEFNHAVRSLPKIPKGYATIEEARLYV